MSRSIPAFLLAAALAFGLSAPALAAPVNINKAGAEEIAAALNGIGIKKAKDIVAWRQKNGPFRSVDQLRDVKGIGDRMIERNKGIIRVQ